MFLPGSGYFVLRIRLEGFVSFSLKVENHFTVSGELLHYYYTFIFYLFSAKHASSQAFPRRWNSFLSRGGRTPTTITYTMHRTYLFTHSSLSATLVRTFTFSMNTRRRHHTWERFFAYDLWFFWYKFRFTLPFLRFSGTLSPLDAYAVLWELLLRTTTTEPTLLWNFQQLGGKHSKHKTSTRRYYLWAVFIIILLNSLIFSTTLGNMGIKCFSSISFSTGPLFLLNDDDENCTQPKHIPMFCFRGGVFLPFLGMILLLQLLLELMTPEHDFRILLCTASSELKRKFQFRSRRGQ